MEERKTSIICGAASAAWLANGNLDNSIKQEQYKTIFSSFELLFVIFRYGG
jgi:hypothetical protein